MAYVNVYSTSRLSAEHRVVSTILNVYSTGGSLLCIIHHHSGHRGLGTLRLTIRIL
jgi:hypothetical protein